MQKNDPLIRTKLHLPFTRPGLVSRSRLQEQLAQGLHGPLTLIVAPAGFGKTTLAASGVATVGMPVAWLSLDKNDNQAGNFLSYLVAALQEADNAIGNEAAQLMVGMQPALPNAVLTSLINDLETSGREIVLALDDYQFIGNQIVHEGMSFLLEHCPNTFHLLIASRSDPPLPSARLRARGQLVELRAADLRFTASEAAQFLNEFMDLRLDAESVTALEERTEGWIAGLQMAALSMRGREDIDGFIQAFTGTNRFIMDFMLEEVLSRESEEVQNFLVRTAILTRLTGPLCDAVTGGSNGWKMLENLEKRNLFVVSLDDDRRWYRYHHLFADLLQAKLHQSGQGLVVELLSCAAKWCEAEEQINNAVNYAIAAQDYERVADLAVKNWQQTMDKGEIETVWFWLNALPDDMVRNSAPLSVIFCWVLWLRGQISAIETYLTDAEHAWGKLVESKEFDRDEIAYAQLPATLAALRSFVARYQNEFETAIALAESALNLLPENLSSQINMPLRTMIFVALATAYDGAGDLEKAVEAYTETIRLSRLNANVGGVTGITYRLIGALRLLGRLRAADMACCDALEYIQSQRMARLPAAGILHVAMSEILIEWNDLSSAEMHLSLGIELGKWAGRLDAGRNSAPALMRLRLAREDVSGALMAVEEVEASLGKSPSPLARAELLALKARIRVRQGFLDEARQCIDEAVHLVAGDRGQTGELVTLAISRVKAVQDDPGKAIEELSRSIIVAQESGRTGTEIEIRILRSLVFMRDGKTQKAEADLERALALAEPESYVRVFLDEGQPMKMLLTQWLARAVDHPARDYAIRLLSQFGAEPYDVTTAQGKTSQSNVSSISSEQVLVEPLSPREQEVLQLIALGKTNQEIAGQLVVARGTIKAHAASIYRKLDVANRTEAVARARQLDILR